MTSPLENPADDQRDQVAAEESRPKVLASADFVVFVALLVSITVAFVVLMIAAAPTHGPVSDIRIRNGSRLDFYNVVVGSHHYGDIHGGATTPPQKWGPAYRYGPVSLSAGGRLFSIRPTDYVGETPLGAGDFTYVITVQGDALDIHAEASVTSSGQQP